MRLTSWLIAAVLALGSLLVAAPPAHAATDLVRHLDTSYAVQADGSVHVRQQFDWRFGESGRRGIELGLATRERWDEDRRHDVVYQVSDLQVDSPTGAPDQVSQSTRSRGSVDTLRVRIGDPDKTVEGRDHTYVVTYVLRGALRTFDGAPELFWDVTSDDFPRIERFTVRVSAPGGVQRARCLVGSQECLATLEDGRATLTGSDVPANRPLSAVAALAPGAVTGAEPTLEPRRLTQPALTSLDAEVTYLPGGVLRVEQRMGYRMPDRAVARPDWTLPLRRPHSETEDVVFPLDGLHATYEGQPTTLEDVVPRSGGSTQDRVLQARVERADHARDTGTLVLRYEVSGAATPGPDGVTVLWPIVGTDLGDLDRATVTYRLPGRPLEASCLRGPDATTAAECRDVVVTTLPDGVRYTLSTPATSGARWHARVVLPADAAGDVTRILEPSIDRAERVAGTLTRVGGTAGFAVMLGLGWALGRRRLAPDQRFAAAPPGVVDEDGAPVAPVRGRLEVPVRFTPPDLPPAAAGALLDRRYRPAHLASTIVAAAVDGLVAVRTEPLSVVRRGHPPPGRSPARAVYDHATRPTRGTPPALPRPRLTKMVTAARKATTRVLTDRRYVLTPDAVGRSSLWRDLAAPRHVAFVVAVGSVLAALPVAEFFGSTGVGVFIAAVAGLVLGLLLAHRRSREPALTATGTALREQTLGFRRYIATAEAGQLDFEADADIFRRYLPWAVLFGLTRRWTQVCQQLADAGKIPALDAGLFGRDLTGPQLTHQLSSLGSSVSRASTLQALGSSGSGASGFFSGGGSGGSSGFSGGSSGGGGGGGTSAGSW